MGGKVALPDALPSGRVEFGSDLVRRANPRQHSGAQIIREPDAGW